MKVPLVVLGLQPRGWISLERARELAAACACKKYRHFKVVCITCCSDTTITNCDELFQRAYCRAVKALEEQPEATIGIGLQSGKIPLAPGKLVYTAGAAMVLRKDPATPEFAFTTNERDTDSAGVVVQLLNSWVRQNLQPSHHPRGLAEQLVRRSFKT